LPYKIRWPVWKLKRCLKKLRSTGQEAFVQQMPFGGSRSEVAKRGGMMKEWSEPKREGRRSTLNAQNQVAAMLFRGRTDHL